MNESALNNRCDKNKQVDQNYKNNPNNEQIQLTFAFSLALNRGLC